MPLSAPRTAAVVGAGPAGLMAAETLAAAGLAVTVYDQMPSAGRKFLMAGRGGLNLSNSAPRGEFLARYGAAAPRLQAALSAFPPEALAAWCEGLGQTTFVGSSGRIFPQTLKASPLLRAWLARLAGFGVSFAPRRRFWGFDGPRLVFAGPEGETRVSADVTIFALGGASWPRLGSDGGWAAPFAAAGLAVAPLAPSNCGFDIAWSEHFRTRFAGTPLKNIALTLAGRPPVPGEAMITAHGLEGGAVYDLSGPLREALARGGEVILRVDLKPTLSEKNAVMRLSRPRGSQSTSNFLRKMIGLPPHAIALMRESAGPRADTPEGLAARLKSTALKVTAPRPIARAISSAGGLRFDELDADYMLVKRPGVFAAGEMLDWEAPTGGYLLQACFATGRAAAQGALKWLAQQRAA